MTRPPPTSTLFPYTTLFRSLKQQTAVINCQGAYRDGPTRQWISIRLLWGSRGEPDPDRCSCASACPIPQVTLPRSEEHTSELQSQFHLVCRLLLEKKKEKTQ